MCCRTWRVLSSSTCSRLPLLLIVGELEQLVGRNADGVGEQTDIEQRNVVFPSLHAADVAPIKTGLMGQRLLGQPDSLAKLAQASPEQCSSVILHTAKDARLAVFMSTGYNYHSGIFGGAI